MVDWGEKLGVLLSESLASSVEAAEKAAKYLHASAQAKNATKGDRAKSRRIAWRDPYDSLLRAASAYVSIPPTSSLYDQPADPAAGRAQAVEGGYPLVASFLETDEQRRAEKFLRQYKVDPRQPLEDAANDIILALNEDYKGAYVGSLGGGTGFLRGIGISSDDLALAMRRLVEEQVVLGRVWSLHSEPAKYSGMSPAPSLDRVYGLSKSNEAVSPHYLYAITESATSSDWDGTSPSISYARRGVFHAMDYALYSLRMLSERADYGAFSQTARTMFDSARVYAGQYTQGRIVVAIGSREAERVAWFNVRVVGAGVPPFPADVTASQIELSKQQLSATYDLWVGEAGLQCALQGTTPRGDACDPRDHKITEEVLYLPREGDNRYPWFQVNPAHMPSGPNADPEPFRVSPRTRIYVTKNSGAGESSGKREVVASFVLRGTPTTGIYHFIVPMSNGLSDALSNTLGVDPLNPDETAQLCGEGGLRRDIKLGLESELLTSRASGGDDLVEESWSYYLGLAKNASTEADLLGNELVEKGLEMDMRAEAAREELEDLCGGVVNVGDLRTEACGSADAPCDLMKYLEQSTNPEHASIKQCLGVGNTDSATLGPYGVCTWQYTGLDPCTCPPGAEDSCPGRKPSEEEHTAWLRADQGYFSGCYAPIYPKEYNNAHKDPGEFTPEDCRELYVPPVAGGTFPAGYTFEVLDKKLSLTTPLAKKEEVPPYACEQYAIWRGMSAQELKTELTSKKNLDVAQSLFASAAKRIKVKRTDLNFVYLTLDDGTWLKVTGVADNPFGANTAFPCAPHEKLTPSFCSGSNSASLLCGGHCRSNGDAELARVMGMHDVGERLAKAVETMRVLSGSGMGGIEVALWPRPIPGRAPTIWDLSTSGAFANCKENCKFKEEPGFSTRASSADAETLRILTRSRKLSSSTWCNALKAGQEGVTQASDYCAGNTVGWNEEGAIAKAQPFHASWLDKGKGAEKWVNIREVCIPADQNPFNTYSYPFSPPWGTDYSTYLDGQTESQDVPSTEQRRLPPLCDGPDGTRFMTFFDAGGLYTWPVLAENELKSLWLGRLDDLLRTGLAGDETFERIYPLSGANGYRIAEHTGIERYSNPLRNYTYQNLLDAFELACVATAPSYANVDCAQLDNDFNGMADIAKMKGSLNCRSRAIGRMMDSVMLQDVPDPVITALQQQTTAALYPTFQGQYATTVARLYNAIIAIGTSYNALSSNMAAMGPIFESAEAQIASIGYKTEATIEGGIMQMELASNECSRARQQIAVAAARGALSGAASGNAAWGSVWGTLSFGGSAALGAATGAGIEITGASIDSNAACDAEDIQKKHTEIINELTRKGAEADIVTVIQSAALSLNDIHRNMETASDGIKTAYADAQAALSELAAQRNAARRAAAKLLMLDNDDVGHEFAVNTAMRARMNTLRVRYERARDYAIRMAYLARRSLEQKIGIELNDLGDDVGWVPAPRSWADTICSLSGIDYDKIRDGDMQPSAAENNGKPYDYADQYVGDYVRRLEEFITAYENTYVSQTGRDTTLVSVRDELLNVRDTSCDVMGVNHLLQATEALNVAPFWFTQDDKRDYEGEQVWESSCDARGVCVKAAAEPNENPFTVYRKNEAGEWLPSEGSGDGADAPSWGTFGNIVRPVRLTATQSAQGRLADPNAPQLPPEDGKVIWFRADSCTESSLGISSWTNRANGSEIGATPSATRLISAGIGGMPTVEVTNGILQLPATTGIDRNHFTISFVSRTPVGSQVFYWYTSTAFPDQTTRYGGAQVLNQPSNVGFSLNWQASSGSTTAPAAQVSTPFPGPPEARPEVGSIATIVADGDAGFRLYVNGALVGGSQQPMPTLRMASVILNTGGVAQLAEHISYDRALSPAELTTLHRYLGARYNISTTAPLFWLDAQEILAARENGGTGPASGYTRPLNSIFDRVMGFSALQSASTNLPSGPTEEFAGDQHWVGLNFDGNDLMWIPSMSSRYDQPQGSGTPGTYVYANPLQTDVAHTLVMRVEASASNQTFFWSPLGDGSALSVAAVPSNGSLTVTLGTNTFTTAEHVFIPHVPFILTIRGSAERDEYALYVNGQHRLSAPGYRPHESVWLGDSYNAGLIGSMAERQTHSRLLSEAEITDLHGQLGLKHGIVTAAGVDDGSGAVTGGSRTPTPRYQQWVGLQRGRYLLSWYQRDSSDDGSSTVEGDSPVLGPEVPPMVVRVSGWQGQPIRVAPQPVLEEERWLKEQWRRHSVTFQVEERDDILIGWEVPDISIAAAGILFAAPQLEGIGDLESATPSPFFPTDDDLYAPVGVCEDREGSQFRNKYWGYGCEYYCPPELGSRCVEIATDPTNLPRRCFYELKFNLSQGALEKGTQVSQGGFAAGNFNYRFEDIAVNVVGTGVKSCESSETASACYTNNFLQYSLRQDGPFLVRNYLGREYEAPLYPGRIQQGKALLAERYLSNPLSSADEQLLKRYWETEFVGRPLDGAYSLRVYDSPDLKWESLEDIQLLINYRYWTRLN